MKSLLYAFCLVFLLPYLSFAQIGSGGLPLSFQLSQSKEFTPVHSYALPNWEEALAESQTAVENGFSAPYLVGLFVSGSVTFPSSGTMSTDKNGNKIWQTKIQIQGAPAIGLYFDKFYLPSGTKLYLSNQNKQQILGAYTSKNNNEEGMFACEAVQGDIIEIELNISSEVNMKEIDFSINKMLVYYRSISYLAQYAQDQTQPAKPTGDPDPYDLEGSSSTCNVNAICPLGVNYPKQRKATAQIIVPLPGGNGAGLCSATMVNNTGNSTLNCKQYLLSATHCEGSNSYISSASPFSQMLVRFNFEKTQCQGGPLATVNTMNGVKLVARSNYTNSNPPQINGDFLLLELKSPIPNSWDIYLAGWNNAGNISNQVSLPKRFIGFHHPSGDVKKIATAQTIAPNGNAGGSDNNTHWSMLVEEGGIEQGSSGSGLFDGDGRVIGIASVAGYPTPGCGLNGNGESAQFLKFVNYSKLSYNWENASDSNMAIRKLKPWLDPTHSGVSTIATIKANCSDLNSSGIAMEEAENLENAIGIYPNPSTSGIVLAKFNFKQTTHLKVRLYSITGVYQKSFELNNIQKETYSFDLKEYANGLYLLKFEDGNSIVTKKISLLQ